MESPDWPIWSLHLADSSVRQPVAVNTTADWCSVCANTVNRGCAALTAAADQGAAVARPEVSPVGAGFIGAGMTLAVVALMAGVLAFLGLLSVGKFRKRRSRSAGAVRGLYARLRLN